MLVFGRVSEVEGYGWNARERVLIRVATSVAVARNSEL